MSYLASVLKDYPVGFWPLSSSAEDKSGCGNDGVVNGTHQFGKNSLIPHSGKSTSISGSSYISIPLDKDYYSSSVLPAIANSSSSTKEFTIELWFKPESDFLQESPLFADVLNGTGIFYQNGNIIFKIEDVSLEYTLSNINKSLYIACIYGVNSMSIYVDGEIVATKNTDGFKFEAEDVDFQVGPVVGPSDSFLINGISVYRYALSSDQIYGRFSSLYNIPPIQIADPNNGSLFEIKNKAYGRKFTFNYPIDKDWSEIAESPVRRNEGYGYLELSQTDGEVSKELIDVLSIPSMEEYNHSVIEWEGDNGVSIYISQDNSTFNECKNGLPLPISDFTKSVIYLKIKFTSSNAQRFNPRLHKLNISFFKDVRIYSENSASYIAKSTGGSHDFGFTWNNKPILSQSKYNGLRAEAKFSLYTDRDVRTLETFYTPDSLEAGSLFDQLSWNGAGTLSNPNILALYINGEDKTSETSVSGLFEVGQLHHVVAVLSDSITEEIVFNDGSNEALYQYITIYESQMDAVTAQAHYEMYVDSVSTIAVGGSLSMTENSINYYDNDWVVIQNI